MRKFIAITAMILCTLTAFGQKPSKAERAEAERLAYEAAVESLQAKTFVLVPTQYTADGIVEQNDDNGIFLSSEGENMFSYGRIVCANTYNNIGKATAYDVNIDKKGNVKVVINVTGRFWRGNYVIKMKKNRNMAEVIFTPNNGTSIRFSGPIVPLAGADYFKRSNPL